MKYLRSLRSFEAQATAIKASSEKGDGDAARQDQLVLFRDVLKYVNSDTKDQRTKWLCQLALSTDDLEYWGF